MSDDEADPELLDLLRKSLGLATEPSDALSPDTGVLRAAEHVYTHAIDVQIDMRGSQAAAARVWAGLKKDGEEAAAELSDAAGEVRGLRERGWGDEVVVGGLLVRALLGFGLEAEADDGRGFPAEWEGRRGSGDAGLSICLLGALDQGVPITSPKFWLEGTSDEVLRAVFRVEKGEEMPFVEERIAILREAGRVMLESFADPKLEDDDEDEEFALRTEDAKAETLPSSEKAAEPHPGNTTAESRSESDAAFSQSHPENTTSPPKDKSVLRLIQSASNSTGKLVNLLTQHFPPFRDEARFEGERVRFQCRAQRFVTDLWAAFDGRGYGAFEDMGRLTACADHGLPQTLQALGVLVYSPPLAQTVRSQVAIARGGSWEVQMRGCSVWAVELIRREIVRLHGEVEGLDAVGIERRLRGLAEERKAG